ncbi:MAG: hypothetical protein C4558_05565 [Dehalococcoidia bacterium]|nr:MAG: hypothetical protein C4558_05565 [Dehalococcoidia bacterium]
MKRALYPMAWGLVLILTCAACDTSSDETASDADHPDGDSLGGDADADIDETTLDNEPTLCETACEKLLFCDHQEGGTGALTDDWLAGCKTQCREADTINEEVAACLVESECADLRDCSGTDGDIEADSLVDGDEADPDPPDGDADAATEDETADEADDLEDGDIEEDLAAFCGEADKPVARVALDRQIPVEFDVYLEGISAGTQMAFSGDVSYDPDEDYPLTYAWTLQRPEDASGGILPNNEASAVSTTFDMPGEWAISLRVADSQGCPSNKVTIHISVIPTCDALNLVLTFNVGEGEPSPYDQRDVDLRVTSPHAGSCSDNTINGDGACLFPLGDGMVVMTQWSNGAGQSGTTERMSIVSPAEGPWTVSVLYANDCKSWFDFSIPSCLSAAGTDFRLELWCEGSPGSRTVLTGTLQRAGDRMDWRLIIIDGEWRPPQPL